MEVGCGASEHSLRIDAELAVAKHRNARENNVSTLVRVDPGLHYVPRGAGLGLGIRAKDCLLAIRDQMKVMM